MNFGVSCRKLGLDFRRRHRDPAAIENGASTQEQFTASRERPPNENHGKAPEDGTGARSGAAGGWRWSGGRAASVRRGANPLSTRGRSPSDPHPQDGRGLSLPLPLAPTPNPRRRSTRSTTPRLDRLSRRDADAFPFHLFLLFVRRLPRRRSLPLPSPRRSLRE